MPDPLTEEFDGLTAHDLRAQGSYKWTRYGGDTIGAFVAEMDFQTAPAVTAALREAVDRTRLNYLPGDLRDRLVRHCAAWQERRYGWSVAPGRVYPVADVLTSYELTVAHLTRPGSPVIVPTPAYPPFLHLPPRQGRQVLEVPMVEQAGRYDLDLDRIEAAFRAGGQLLVLCNPANPTGRVFTPGELAPVTDLVARYGGRVFADEVHAPLTYPGHRHTPYAATSPTAAGHTVTAVSTSKAWNVAGLKCAQVIVNPDDQPVWERVGTVGPAAPSTLGAVAAAAAYDAGERWLDEVLGYLDRNRRRLRELLDEHLPAVGYRPPEGTYLAWLDCRELGVGDRPAEFFRDQAGVALLEGADCGPAGRGWARLTFATPQPVLERIVTRLAHATGRGRPGDRD